VKSEKEDGMATVREDWLELTIEEAIEPELPICDPHHHLWYNTDHNYTIEEFRQDIAGGHRIVQTVFVESRLMLKKDAPREMQPVGETEFVQNIVAQNEGGQYGVTNIAAGIVGFADLTLGDAVSPVLEAHIAASRDRFRGIRYTTAWDASPDIKSHWDTPGGLLLNARFREGFACLQRYGLSFDAWLYHTQLMELVDLARAFPATTIIVNHIGGPLSIGPYAKRRKEVFQDWKRDISMLANCPNVVLKLGGLGMSLFGFGWHEQVTPPSSSVLAEAMAPYFDCCLEQVGVKRCMFESNFPVDKRAYSYTVLWNSFKHMTRDFSRDERRALFHDTAVTVYRLPAKHEV
jgi:L-fuconolactonase